MAKHRFTAKRAPKALKGKPPAKGKKKGTAKANKRATKNGPHSRALPGMGQVRNTRLDNFCESIGRTRQKLASLRLDEQGDLQGALNEMHDRKIASYLHAGVELTRVAGSEKIRARLIDESRATTANEPPSDADETDAEDVGGDDGGSGDEGGDQE